MKSRTKASLAMAMGGLVLLLSSFNDTMIPRQFKMVSAGLLFIYGLFVLTFEKSEAREGFVKKWTLPVILLLIFFGIGIYYYLNSSATPRVYEKLTGTFEIPLMKRSTTGTAILDEDKLTLQFLVYDSSLRINGFTILKDSIPYKESIDFTFALSKDFEVLYGTTDPQVFVNSRKVFYDDDLFTVMFAFEETLKVDSISQLSFVVHTNSGDNKVLISSAKK